MATAFSQPTQFTPYVENWDKDLVQKALMYKQGKYDLNRQKIQSTINSAISLDLAKDEDADYLYGKLKETLDVVNQYGSGDLSLDSRTDYLQGHISSVADDNVMNGYLGTLKLRNIQKEASVAKKEGLYSDLNFAYSMQDAQKWLSDGTVGSEYSGNSSYVPYSDNDKKFREVIKELDPHITIQETLDGKYKYYKEGKEVSPARIKGAIELLMMSDPAAAKQMQVNAWAQYQGMDDNTFFNSVAPTINSTKNEVNDDINSLKKEALLRKPNDPERVEIEKLIGIKEEQLKLVDKLSSDRTSLENFLYKNEVLNGYSTIFAKSSVTTKIDANEIYYKDADLALKTAQFEIDKQSKGLDIKFKVLEAYNNQNEGLAKGLLNAAKSMGYDLPSYNEIVSGETLPNIQAGGIEVDEINVQQKYSDIKLETSQEKLTLDKEVLANLRSLEKDGVLDSSIFVGNINSTPWLSGVSSTPPILLTQDLDTDNAVEYFRKNGLFTSTVEKYDLQQLKISKIAQYESTLLADVTKKTNDWLASPKEGKRLSVGGGDLVYFEGNYYGVPKGTVIDKNGNAVQTIIAGNRSVSIPVPLSKPFSTEQVNSFIKNEVLVLDNPVQFDGQTYSVTSNRQLMTDKFTEIFSPILYTTGKIPIIGGTKGTGVGGKNLASEMSTIILNDATFKEKLDKNDGQYRKVITFMQDPNNFDKLFQNELGVAGTEGTQKINVLGSEVFAEYDLNKGEVILKIGDGEDGLFNIPISKVPSNTATMNNYAIMLEEKESQTQLSIKENRLISGWDFSKVPYRTQPAFTSTGNKINGDNVDIDFNVTALFQDKGVYKFETSILFRTENGDINIGTSTLTKEFRNASLTNYYDAYLYLEELIRNPTTLKDLYTQKTTKK